MKTFKTVLKTVLFSIGFVMLFSTTIVLTLCLISRIGGYKKSTLLCRYESSEYIKKLSEEIAGDCETDAEKVNKIYQYISVNFTYDMVKDEGAAHPFQDLGTSFKNRMRLLYLQIFDAHNEKEISELKHWLNYYGFFEGTLPNIDKIIDTKKGVCRDFSALYTALCRTQGIPCKIITGIGEDDGGKYGHAWVQPCIDGVWYTVDITAGVCEPDFAKKLTCDYLADDELPEDIFFRLPAM